MFSGARQLGFIIFIFIRLGIGSDDKIISGKFARTIKGFFFSEFTIFFDKSNYKC